MPARNYRGTTTPPRWWEKLLSHPLEVSYGTMGVLLGLLVLLGEAFAFEPSRNLAGLPTWNGLMLGVLLLVGSTAILLALLAPLPDLEAEFLHRCRMADR